MGKEKTIDTNMLSVAIKLEGAINNHMADGSDGSKAKVDELINSLTQKEFEEEKIEQILNALVDKQKKAFVKLVRENDVLAYNTKLALQNLDEMKQYIGGPAVVNRYTIPRYDKLLEKVKFVIKILRRDIEVEGAVEKLAQMQRKLLRAVEKMA